MDLTRRNHRRYRRTKRKRPLRRIMEPTHRIYRGYSPSNGTPFLRRKRHLSRNVLNAGTMENEYPHIEIDKIGERFAGLRIVHPRAEAEMEKSMKTYGQSTPVVAGRFEVSGYEMIDGFKRLRTAARLDMPKLEVRVFSGNVRAAKAAMIHLNSKGRTITELEKGLVIRSLHRGART